MTLREVESPRRQVEIYIGAPEAAAIKSALDGEATPRPMTHDLFVLALERIGVEVARVVLTRVTEGTYHADLVLTQAGGEETTVSCRPSDGIALALPALSRAVKLQARADEVGEVQEQAEDDEIIDEFKSFIENISPEDFEG
ncbi:MAG: bifunctional nuclease domain-containing protein [Ilumatobacteraceae bacterium]